MFKAGKPYAGTYNIAADEWVNLVYQKLQESNGELNLSNIMQLRSHYLSHLVIPCKQAFYPKIDGLLTPKSESPVESGKFWPTDWQNISLRFVVGHASKWQHLWQPIVLISLHSLSTQK